MSQVKETKRGGGKLACCNTSFLLEKQML